MKARPVYLRSDWMPKGYVEVPHDQITIKGDLIYCFNMAKKKWFHSETTNQPGYHGDTIFNIVGKDNPHYKFFRKVAK